MAEKNYKIAGRFYDTMLKIIDWEKQKRRIDESHEDWSFVMDRIAGRYYSLKKDHEKDDQFFPWDIIAVFQQIVHYVLEDYDPFTPESKPDWFSAVEALKESLSVYTPKNHESLD